VRRALPRARVVRTGMALSRLPAGGARPAGAVIACGLAGSLLTGVPTGTVLVPRRVLRPDGRWLECDPALVEALSAAARRLGHEPEPGPMATTRELVVGPDRRTWAARGCVGVDMETGLLNAERVATVRVVLDTPDRELHPAWRRPLGVLWRPAALAQLPWLTVESWRCARRAADVLAAALAQDRPVR
jgi:Phosphorylase superfamily